MDVMYRASSLDRLFAIRYSPFDQRVTVKALLRTHVSFVRDKGRTRSRLLVLSHTYKTSSVINRIIQSVVS